MDVGWLDFDVGAFGIDFGNLKGVPLLFNVMLRYPTKIGDTNVTFYGLVGAGVIFWEFDDDSILDKAETDIKVDRSFAFRIGGGTDFFLNDTWAVNFEGSYTFSDANMILALPDGVFSTEEDTDFWMIGGGLKHYFK